jgi:hypothetical protein
LLPAFFLVVAILAIRTSEGAELLHRPSDAAVQLAPYSLAQAACSACADE